MSKFEPCCPSCKAKWPEALTEKPGADGWYDCKCLSTFFRPDAIWYAKEKADKLAAFEAENRDDLVKAIAEYYADGYAGPGESSSPPDYAEVGFQLDDGIEIPLNADALKAFNTEVADAFEAAIEGWDGPSDYEEHNTLWKGSAI